MKYSTKSLRLLTEAIDMDNLPDLKEYMSRSERGAYVWHNDENGLRYTWSPVTRYVRAYVDHASAAIPRGQLARGTAGQILAKNVTDYSVAKAIILRRFARDIESGRKNRYIKPFSTSPNFERPGHSIPSDGTTLNIRNGSDLRLMEVIEDAAILTEDQVKKVAIALKRSGLLR